MSRAPVAVFQEKEGEATPAVVGLIDLVGVDAVAALGFYKLRNAYGGDCIQVRRESDSATQDIGFTLTGELDTAAIATFCGSSQGRLAIWYDQSGNGFDFNATQNSQAGTTANQPIIYYNYGGATGYAVTTDAAGNIAAFSAVPGSSSAQGTLFLNSPTMDSKQSPTITMFVQVNVHNGNGIYHTELSNGYNQGTYGGAGNIKIIRSNGSNLVTRSTINTDATDPFASTVFYCDDCGSNLSKWWITSELNNATFEASFTTNGFNVAAYANATIFRYYSPTLYQNCAISGYIYWDLTSGTTLSATELNDLYTWVETNLGYTNNAP